VVGFKEVVKQGTNTSVFMLLVTEGVPREIVVIMSASSAVQDDIWTESRPINSQLPQELLELKRKLDEMEKERNELEKEKDEMKQIAEKLLAQEKKRAKREPKRNLERGNDFVPLTKIEESRRLSAHTMYSVCKLVRTQLFCNMKYFSEYYKEDCLRKSFDALNMRNEEDQKRYRDYIVCYIEKKTTSQRNNAIYALKRRMMGEDGEGKS
jgi:hypothetical protein